jgi:hypothetical protein
VQQSKLSGVLTTKIIQYLQIKLCTGALEEEEEYTIYAVNKLRKQYEKGISTQAKENPKAGIILNQKQMNWIL